MRQVIKDQHPALFIWAAARIPGEFDPEKTRWIGLVDGEEILAVVMYTNFSKFDCCMHLATARKDWASKEFMRAAFAYPFEELDLPRVTLAAESKNEAALRLHKKLGARHEGTLRKFLGGCDLVINGLLKSECKYLKGASWAN